MQQTVTHYLSTAPESAVVTRARCVSFDRTDDVSFFMNDRIIGALCVPRGQGEALCAQLGLIRRGAVPLSLIESEFRRAVNEAG